MSHGDATSNQAISAPAQTVSATASSSRTGGSRVPGKDDRHRLTAARNALRQATRRQTGSATAEQHRRRLVKPADDR